MTTSPIRSSSVDPRGRSGPRAGGGWRVTPDRTGNGPGKGGGAADGPKADGGLRRVTRRRFGGAVVVNQR